MVYERENVNKFPPCVLDFGAFTWISQDLPLYFKSFHRRLVAESIFVIVPFSSSPILKEPKKAMQLTVQNNCLLSFVQFVIAISFPSIFRRESVITFLLRVLQGS